jgi:GWxTD domain-containing protein
MATATEALQYLMSANEFEEFMKLSDEEMKKQLEIFWKKRDPTPKTAYNEAMAEYYQRCDYALENFRTLSHADGIKTDRGKIYVLYGPPTKTDRFLTPNTSPKEIWYYDNLQLKFVFIDESRSGNYKLLSSEKL